MMKFKTFAKLWLIDELESREYSYLSRERALHFVVGNYRNFFLKIHSLTLEKLLEVVAHFRKESESDILDSIRSDYDLYKKS